MWPVHREVQAIRGSSDRDRIRRVRRARRLVENHVVRRSRNARASGPAGRRAPMRGGGSVPVSRASNPVAVCHIMPRLLTQHTPT